MQDSFYFVAGLASVFAFAGIFSLYSAWSSKGAQPLRSWLGWAMLVLSAVGWSLAVGTEFGISIAALIVMLGVFALLAVRGEWPSGPRPIEKQRSGGVSEPGALRQLWLRGILRFLSATFLPLVSGIVAGLLFFGFTGLSDSWRLVGGAFVSVTIWTLAMVWVCADKKLLRPSAGLLAFSVLSGLMLKLAIPAVAA
ncbi:hypothetical protein Misp06_00367 [Microbulbifer sp. NBRC 101763]|uniref:hypothetical protein n=1 Tax=unclassified Microbulbifer TaxID=2619833 RepID=UPI00309F28CC